MKLLFYLSIFLFGCNSLFSQSEEVERLNDRIKKTLFKNPDSAKIYLNELLKYSRQLDDTTMAHVYSYLGISYNQTAVYDSSEFYFKKGISLTRQYPLHRAKLFSNLAINYRTHNEYKKSLEALDSAMTLYNQSGDRTGEGVVYGEMASNYSYMLEKQKAIEYLKKSIAIFEATKDSRLHIIQQKLANAYFNNGNYKFATDLFEQALPKFAEEKNISYYLTLPAYAESLIHLGRLEEGEDRLNEARKGLAQMNNREYMFVVIGKLGVLYNNTNRPKKASKALTEAYHYLRAMGSSRFLEISRAYLHFLNQEGRYTKGLEVIEEVKEATDNFKNKLNVEEELHFLEEAKETYRNSQLYEKSLQAFDRIDFLKDSLREAVDRVKLKELEESFQNEIQREKNISLEAKNTLLKENSDKQRNIIILELAVLFVLVISIFAIYRIHLKKLKFEKEAVKNLQAHNEILQEKQKLDRELREEKENNLAIKERELVDMSMEIADVQSHIKTLIKTAGEGEISSNLAAKIVDILNQKNYWKYFKTKFMDIHPEFGSTLAEMYPSLSENDLAFASMLKLQLTDKEIASMMGISEQKVASKKYVLQKKMNLEEDVESFNELIHEL